ncbi:large subunit ribosomal protein L25 [Pullulanibacillus pueri]|uniref:Large ribosomal subunit protein bL25 n=1 Tax=Pullulanibacillus pueri TaxID=1437324 RepID=A0A8J2ZZF5_9BACL|nr:50S ribosomal protein L25/general stress protein Ctc [Pullulanibacillus pueri]MBM7684009.1 large subunit ribosomal protein L25 [Pullulanibacillus pueri]GGH88304.1 50S ribosomal protein L25 [Pullulanibacillus pueri]
MPAQLNVKERDNSKHSFTRALRDSGKIPAVVYGKTVGNRGISVDESDMIRVFRDSGRNSVISLNIDGQAFSAMVQDLQVDPLKGHIVHIDFLEVDMKVEKEAVVPLHTVGEAVGQKEGGVVQHNVNELTVKALPANIPAAIEVDISALTIGDVLKVKDIPVSGDYEILDEGDEVVISVQPPTLEPEVDEEQQEAEASTEEKPANEGEEA